MNTGDAKAWLANRVSRETFEKLEAYHALLVKWQGTINLVAPSTMESAWTRHFVDSAQLFSLAPDTAARWLDLGSGGGFPGLVIAVLAKEHRPDVEVTLVESDIRKCGFMREAARKMEVNVHVLPQRIEDIAPQNAGIVSSRALSNLATLFAHVERHTAPGACLLFPKGNSYKEDLASAPPHWQSACEVIPSHTDDDAVVLRFVVPNLKKDC